MLSNTLQAALNDQVTNELEAAHSYLAMAAWCEHANLPGFAHWLRLQSQEETSHAMKIFDFIHDRGGRVEIGGLNKPNGEFQSALEVMEKVLEQERNVTGMINRIYDLAVKEHDYPTQVLMNWFVEEQVEEEKNAEDIIARLKLAGSEGLGLLMVDKELGAR